MTKIPQHKYPQPLISVIEKLYPAGRSQFIRFCQGETVHYALDLLPEYAGHQLSTMGNLPQGVPKISDQGTTYPSIDLGHCPPGHYHFKALISNGTDHKFDSSG